MLSEGRDGRYDDGEWYYWNFGSETHQKKKDGLR